MTAHNFIPFAKELARVSGEVILPHYRALKEVVNKGEKAPYDPVTVADKEAEAVIRKLINQHYPDHGIIGEEYGNEKENADYVWILDPIDGTKAFVCGFPVWGTLIGLLYQGQPILGLMHQPFTKELFWGDNKQAFSNFQGAEKQIFARQCPSLEEAIISTTSGLLFDEQEYVAYKRVEKASRFVRYGGDCYAYAMVAAGQIDCVVEMKLAPYDIIPHIPILKGAGATVTTWENQDAVIAGKIVASSSLAVHTQVLDLLKP